MSGGAGAVPAPRISIAMATFNGARFLQEQLDSFARQSLLPDELVVCDDGSTDATLAILAGFAATAPFVMRVCRNPQTLGFVRNFEKALTLCEGDLVYFSDQDDVWFSEKLAVMTAQMQCHPDWQVAVCDQRPTTADLTAAPHTRLENYRRFGSGALQLSAGCAMVLRQSFKAVVLPLPPECTSHDNWIHLLGRAYRVTGQIDTALQYHRQHGANVSTSPLSMPAGVGVTTLFRALARANPRLFWQKDAEMIAVAGDRIRLRHMQNAALGLDSARALSLVQRELAARQSRLRIIARARWMRLPAILTLWRRGGYGRNFGWRSAALDLMRR